MPSLNELLNQKNALDRQIAEMQRAGRAAAVTQIRSLMGEYGLALGDVLTAAEKRKMANGGAATVTVSAPAAAAPAKPGRKAKKVEKAAKPAKATKPSKAGKPLGKVAIKYRDKDTGSTWTGRGLKPKWLSAYLAAGRKIEEFAV
jgi:DNA-binding protein H-NS